MRCYIYGGKWIVSNVRWLWCYVVLNIPFWGVETWSKRQMWHMVLARQCQAATVFTGHIQVTSERLHFDLWFGDEVTFWRPTNQSTNLHESRVEKKIRWSSMIGREVFANIDFRCMMRCLRWLISGVPGWSRMWFHRQTRSCKMVCRKPIQKASIYQHVSKSMPFQCLSDLSRP